MSDDKANLDELHAQVWGVRRDAANEAALYNTARCGWKLR